MNFRNRILTAAVGVGLALGSSGVRAADVNWTDGTGFWDVATNWDSNPLLPGAADDVVINVGGTHTITVRATGGPFTVNSITMTGDEILAIIGGALTVNGASTFNALAQSAGTLGGTGLVTITGPATWTGGTNSGTGTTQFDNTLSISGAALKIIFGGRTVNLNGATTWTGNTANNNNVIRFWNGGTLNNNGTFSDENTFDSFVEHNVGGPHSFNNAGTFNKQSNTTTNIDGGVAFNNTGTVNVNAGTFLPNGGGTSTGTFNIAPGATLEFRNGAHTLDNVTTSGDGTLMISTENVGADAVVTLNGGTHTTPFLFSGSRLQGTDHTFQGPANTWTGGTIAGAASTTFVNDITISGPNTKTIFGGRILNLDATTTWTGNTAANNNVIRFWNGATLNNLGTFNDENLFNSFIEHSVGGPHNFNNIGTFNKQTNTITSVDGGIAFNNTGTVNVNAGTLLMGASGTSTGTFNIAPGATLEFRNGAPTLDNATTSGAGLLVISTDNVGGDAVVTVNGGTHTTPFLLSGSVLTGSNTFQGPATWTGGRISGAGTTQFDNTLDIIGPNSKAITGGRVVNLMNVTTWGGNTANLNNSIFFSNGTINNTGTFNDTNTFNSLIDTLGANAFNNSGTYNKEADAITTIEIPFNNTGMVNVNAGTLNISSAFDNQGTITTATGATFGTTSLFRDLQNHGVLQGTGTYDPATGRTLLNAGQVQPGTPTRVGDLSVAGNYTQTSAGLIEFDLASLTDFDTLDVAGNLSLNGTLQVSSLGGYNPVIGDTFTVITFDDGVADASDRTGVFSSVVGVEFAPGTIFAANYFDHSVVVSVIAAPIPEPSTVGLLGSSLFGLIGLTRRARPRPL